MVRILRKALLYGLFVSSMVIVFWSGCVIVQYDSPGLVELQQLAVIFGVGIALLFQIAYDLILRGLHLIWGRLQIYGYDD